jgi:deoxyinosine 3'endonuclease (endonuclease V)
MKYSKLHSWKITPKATRKIQFDEQGIAHPFGFGEASQLGLMPDKPSAFCPYAIN